MQGYIEPILLPKKNKRNDKKKKQQLWKYIRSMIQMMAIKKEQVIHI